MEEQFDSTLVTQQDPSSKPLPRHVFSPSSVATAHNENQGLAEGVPGGGGGGGGRVQGVPGGGGGSRGCLGGGGSRGLPPIDQALLRKYLVLYIFEWVFYIMLNLDPPPPLKKNFLDLLLEN